MVFVGCHGSFDKPDLPQTNLRTAHGTDDKCGAINCQIVLNRVGEISQTHPVV